MVYSSAATQVNEILVEPEKFSNICLNYLNCALALLDEGKYNQNIKVELIEDIPYFKYSYPLPKNLVKNSKRGKTT